MRRLLLFSLLFLVTSLLSVGASEYYEASLEKSGHYHSHRMIEGGSITDGMIIGDILFEKREGFERILFGFYHGTYQELGPPAESVPFFRLRKEEYPLRLVLEIYGVRGFLASFPSLEESLFMEEVDRLPLLDDSGMRFCICLKEEVAYEVFLQKDPALLVIDMIEEEMGIHPPVYSLRTEGDKGIEEAGYIEELFYSDSFQEARIIKGVHGELYVEAAYYLSLGEALGAWWRWMEGDLFSKLVIEKREYRELPGTGILLY